LLLQAGAI
jgi:hypothetical protein